MCVCVYKCEYACICNYTLSLLISSHYLIVINICFAFVYTGLHSANDGNKVYWLNCVHLKLDQLNEAHHTILSHFLYYIIIVLYCHVVNTCMYIAM